MYQLRTESNAAWWWRKHGMNEWIGGIALGVLGAYMLYLGVPTT